MIKSEASVAPSTGADKLLKHKRRYCRTVGCTRIVKSQGLCQRHGAKPRQCRVEGCLKQAQGNFDGMCKSHFKSDKHETTTLPPKPNPTLSAPEPPQPTGESVYDRILPASLAWNPITSAGEMPLIEHFKQGILLEKPPAWHRNEERQARGLWPVRNAAMQLEAWERELVWMEILLLTGTPESSFLHLARGWGRDKGFHMVLSQFICERHGDVERKKRERSHVGKGRRPIQVKNEGDYIGADVWDNDTCHGDTDYNEALVADLMMFDGETSPTDGQHMHARNSSFMSSQSFTFHEEDGAFSDELDYSSSADGFSDESDLHSHDDDEHAHAGSGEADGTASGVTAV
jgi:hypothetical protein